MKCDPLHEPTVLFMNLSTYISCELTLTKESKEKTAMNLYITQSK